MKANERLQDYTNQFFENRSTCVSVRDDQVVDSYKKGLRTAKSLRRSTSPVPRRSRHSWRSSTNSSTPRKLWSTSVGDSHKGPLNNQGETRLKPAKTRITDQLANSKHAHDAITVLVPPVARQGGTAEHLLSKLRLARGLRAPSGGVRLARGLNALPRAESASFEASTHPRARSALIEALTPLGRGPPRSRAQRPHGRDRLTEGTCTHVVHAPAPVYGHLML
jgi:hypothetical protein